MKENFGVTFIIVTMFGNPSLVRYDRPSFEKFLWTFFGVRLALHTNGFQNIGLTRIIKATRLLTDAL